MTPALRHAAAALAAFVIAASAGTSFGHELRPAYLELVESEAGLFQVTWKVPRVGDATLALRPHLPQAGAAPVRRRIVDGAAVATWTAELGELRGKTIAIEGLDTTLTDALVRIELADGLSVTQRLDARTSRFEVPASASAFAVAGTYFGLGVEHILLGFDHLLFVVTLVLLTGWRRSLLGTVTAFTVAHSVTLALATVGVLNVPSPPVEAAIALSIAFMAAELVRRRNGDVGFASSATWIVAFAFGLLHGLGFAGALSETGLPADHIPVALLLFNVGVEVGQLLFLALVWLATTVSLRLWRGSAAAFELSGAYAIGIVSMFWVFSRVAAF